jgi:hypothetical protein
VRRLYVLALAPVLCPAQPGTISGDYLEDRANKVFGCYCEWSGEGEQAGREAILGWSVRTGVYRGVNLAGARFAVVIQGQSSLSRYLEPRRSILLVDAAADEARRAAVEALVRANFGALLGELVEVRPERLEFRRDAAGARLRAGEVVNVEMRKARLPEDALQGAITWYDPFVPLERATLGTTLNAKYAGAAFGNRWERSDPGVTGYFGEFRIEAK